MGCSAPTNNSDRPVEQCSRGSFCYAAICWPRARFPIPLCQGLFVVIFAPIDDGGSGKFESGRLLRLFLVEPAAADEKGNL